MSEQLLPMRVCCSSCLLRVEVVPARDPITGLMCRSPSVLDGPIAKLLAPVVAHVSWAPAVATLIEIVTIAHVAVGEKVIWALGTGRVKLCVLVVN